MQGKEELRDAPILQHLLILQTQQYKIQETMDIMDKNAIQKSGWIYVRLTGKWLLEKSVFSISKTRFLLSGWKRKPKPQKTEL